MLEIKCDRCHEELKEQGALVFGPPPSRGLVNPMNFVVRKIHLCVRCWDEVYEYIFPK